MPAGALILGLAIGLAVGLAAYLLSDAGMFVSWLAGIATANLVALLICILFGTRKK